MLWIIAFFAMDNCVCVCVRMYAIWIQSKKRNNWIALSLENVETAPMLDTRRWATLP